MMLLACLLVLALTSAEDNIKNVEKAEKELKNSISLLDLIWRHHSAVGCSSLTLKMSLSSQFLPFSSSMPPGRPRSVLSLTQPSTTHFVTVCLTNFPKPSA